MLSHAKARVAAADAVHLPFRSGTFDFVYCVNAFHHFGDRAAYLNEVRRVLAPDGSTTVVAIDATRIPAWFMHDYFDGAKAIDLARYATLEQLAELMQAAGFSGITTRQVERAEFNWTKDEVLASPLTTRESNSLLALLSDDVFARGIERIRAAPPETRFITDMPFFAVAGYLPQL
jgi:SAM-dependent methyltransferase